MKRLFNIAILLDDASSSHTIYCWLSYKHSVHWGINPPKSKKHHPSFLPSPPPNRPPKSCENCNLPPHPLKKATPLFTSSPPLKVDVLSNPPFWKFGWRPYKKRGAHYEKWWCIKDFELWETSGTNWSRSKSQSVVMCIVVW